MKTTDLRSKSIEELKELLREITAKLGKLTFERTAKRLTKSSELGDLRRDRARINTILHERTQ